MEAGKEVVGKEESKERQGKLEAGETAQQQRTQFRFPVPMPGSSQQPVIPAPWDLTPAS